MGCISSKAMSIREDLNHGFQSKSTRSGNDQLFALVCSANTMTTKLRRSSFTLPSQTAPEIKNLGNAWELIPDIQGKTEAELSASGDHGRLTRSKSCQISETENNLDRKDKNMTGSRSFHTVEEYDALLERIHNFSTTSTQLFEDYLRFQQSDSLDGNKNDSGIQGTSKGSVNKEPGIREHLNLDCDDASSFTNSEDIDNVAQEDGALETGWKRKALAKGLKSLDVSTIEFPSIARFRQRIHVDGQVYSPGTYVTPKFGSYNAKITPATREKECGENSVFSPEFMAAFEDCMQQLQVEEETILRHMDPYSPLANEMENQLSDHICI